MSADNGTYFATRTLQRAIVAQLGLGANPTGAHEFPHNLGDRAGSATQSANHGAKLSGKSGSNRSLNAMHVFC
jgi:hypothetical protein